MPLSSKDKKQTAIFFEDVQIFHYPVIMYYLMRGYDIHVFDFSFNLKSKKWIRNLINDGKVKCLYIKPSTIEHGQAMDAASDIYGRLCQNGLSQTAADMYGCRQTDLVFKRFLVEEIFKAIYIHSYFTRLDAQGTCLIHFVSISYKFFSEMISQYGNYLQAPLNIKWHLKSLSYLFVICEKIKYCLGAPSYILGKSFLVLFGKLQKQRTADRAHFKYAVGVNFVSQIISGQERGASFLLEGKYVDKKDVVFIINTTIQEKYLMPYVEKDYALLKLKNVYGNGHIFRDNYQCGFLWPLIKQSFVALRSWSMPVPFLKAFFVNMRVFLNWNLVFQRVSFENYIYTNHESPSQSAINLLIRNRGARTWNYACFLGGGYIRTVDKDFIKHRNILWSFLIYDYYIGINEDVIKYYQGHYQNVKKYYAVGSIYSEMIRKSMNILNREEFIRSHFRAKPTDKTRIIAFFDVTFIDSPDAPTCYEDCIGFYEDILKVLDEKKDVFMIIKPSKPVDWFIDPFSESSSLRKGRQIVFLMDQLKASDRVFFVEGVRGMPVFFEHNNAVIAMSDAIVTHCLSSPTVEALAAGKRSFWYESGNRHRGLVYDKIPGLCVHGYEELVKRLDDLLYGTTTEEYDAYLESEIKHRLEPYLDGKALTRFKQLLEKH